MIAEEQIAASSCSRTARLRDAGEALIAAANDAGGRDNITVVLLRLEEVAAPGRRSRPSEERDHGRGPGRLRRPASRRTQRPGTHRRARRHRRVSCGARAARARAGATPRLGRAPTAPPRRRRRAADTARGCARRSRSSCSALLGAAAYLALQSVYFIGTNSRGLVTMFEGLPYRCRAT